MIKGLFNLNKNRRAPTPESDGVAPAFEGAATVGAFLSHKGTQLPFANSYRTLSGMERTSVGVTSNSLLFHADTGAWSIDEAGTLRIPANTTVTSGVFRNSFYYGLWAEYTQVHKLSLKVHAKGKFRLRVFVSAPGRSSECLLSVEYNGKKTNPSYIKLPDLDTLWRHGRLFWDCTSEGGPVEIYDIAYVTDEPPVAEKTILFLGRTFGRTKELVRVLKNLVDQRVTEDHTRFLSSAKFLLLDTSSDNLTEYEELGASRTLNLYVCSGKNLGGGGNAAQVLSLFLKQETAVRETIDNIVLFDDDLDITVESLSRYRNFINYLTKDVIVTLPVLMKSETTTVWEDGGFWGRFHESGGLVSDRTELFPQLIKHGIRLNRFDHLDDFCELNHPEYSTFIYFGMTRSVVERLGYPAPFFLRGDDIEYSLRAGKEKIKILSNPNMCAWHEPAHSYGQEYMAILHGLIINFTYGMADKNVYLRFFNDRFRAHGMIRDGLGIRVYAEVLRSLIHPNCIVGLNFEQHYFEKLGFFKSIDNRFESIDKGIMQSFLRKESADTRYLLPFIYMKSENILSGTYVLQNHHQGTYFFRDLSDVTLDEEFYDHAAEFAALLKEFLEKFDAIMRSFREKLGAGVTEAFWASQLGPLKERRVLGSADTRLLSQPSTRLGGVKNARDAAHSVAKAPKVRPLTDLPPDFDPEGYIRLNPDVQSANVSPVHHYLQFGWSEGRRWR